LIGKIKDVPNWKISEDYFSIAIIKKHKFTGEKE